MTANHTPVSDAFDLLNDSRVRDFIGRELGEMSRLHSVLNTMRPRGAVERYDAAPQLLEALEDAKNFMELFQPWDSDGERETYDKICAAIAKARGQN